MDTRYGYIPEEIAKKILLFNSLPHTRSCSSYLRDLEDSLVNIRLNSVREKYMWFVNVVRHGDRDAYRLCMKAGYCYSRIDSICKHLIRLDLPRYEEYSKDIYHHSIARYNKDALHTVDMNSITIENSGKFLIYGALLNDDHTLALRLYSQMKTGLMTTSFCKKVAYNCGRSKNMIFYLHDNRWRDDWMFSLGAIRGGHIEVCTYDMNDLDISQRTRLAIEAVKGGQIEILKSIMKSGDIERSHILLCVCQRGKLDIVKMLGIYDNIHFYIGRSFAEYHTNIYRWAITSGMITESINEITNMEFDYVVSCSHSQPIRISPYSST